MRYFLVIFLCYCSQIDGYYTCDGDEEVRPFMDMWSCEEAREKALERKDADKIEAICMSEDAFRNMRGK